MAAHSRRNGVPAVRVQRKDSATKATRRRSAAQALDPIASEEELNLWMSCNSKTELATLAASALRRLRQLPSIWDPCGLVLVSSGSSHWLDSLHFPSHDSQLKTPDFYVAWGQCIKGHLKNGELSGVLAGRALQLDGCAREFFEARVGDGALTMEDFGQLVDYHGRVSGVCRGMLFNARHFWLYESIHGHPKVLQKSTLSAPGSLKLARDFFTANPLPTPPTVDLLHRLMGELGLKAVPVGPKGALCSFLGSGRSGRVFEVREGSGGSGGDGVERSVALKVAVNVPREDLNFEFVQLEKAAIAGAPVVRVVPGSLRYFPQCKGGGYLMEEVLLPFEATPLSLPRITSAFVALQQLHSKGFTHGDARLANLMLRSHGKALPHTPVWIDLRTTEEGHDEGQREDAYTLARSVLSLRKNEELPEALMPLLESLESSAPTSYMDLAEALAVEVKKKLLD
jgi:hypothetical protein